MRGGCPPSGKLAPYPSVRVGAGVVGSKADGVRAVRSGLLLRVGVNVVGSLLGRSGGRLSRGHAVWNSVGSCLRWLAVFWWEIFRALSCP